MATYKAVMRPDPEYESFILSPLASWTSINNLQVMQNATLRTAKGCTQDTHICKTKHSYFPYTRTNSPKPHNINRKHNIHHIPYTNILQHYQDLIILYLTMVATQQTFRQTTPSHYNRNKNKHVAHTYIHCL